MPRLPLDTKRAASAALVVNDMKSDVAFPIIFVVLSSQLKAWLSAVLNPELAYTEPFTSNLALVLRLKAWFDVFTNTCPPLPTRRLVADDDPTANAGAAPLTEVGLTENCAHGVVLPTPTLPPKYALIVVVAPPLMVKPACCVPLPIVVDARNWLPPVNVLESPKSVDEAKVQVEVENVYALPVASMPRPPIARLDIYRAEVDAVPETERLVVVAPVAVILANVLVLVNVFAV